MLTRLRVLVQAMTADPMLATPTGNDEWHTPPLYLRAAKEVMGGIDCDPASNAIAQRLVQATVWHDKRDDGLRQRWSGRVWLNPPYSKGMVDRFVSKLGNEWRRGRVTESIVLVNAATDTAWFHALEIGRAHV